MALKTVIPFPIFAPNPTTSTATTPTTTEVRFSRWNNANAEKFNRRTQQQIEDDLRRHRRFESALNITNNYHSTPPDTAPTNFRSTGTPSSPSRSSIPGKKSKYSKQTPPAHPAFRKVLKRTRLPETPPEAAGETEVRVREKGGIGYVVPGAPFEFMYSYTETPRVKPVGLREPAVAPFGPGTMPRPWTGRKPMSKKVLEELDSFRPPPAGKKGVKPVQQPGPYLPGSGPRYVVDREEVLGEALTEEEVKELLDGCRKSKRQLNMGRDGFTHNMLDNIYAHWKRRRVCKIKCKGVCTVDMDNVCQQLEEKTGGKIIYRRGGIVYLFRGRNYNHKTRPRFPLMLWKPVSPMYPRLIQRVPEGLTSEEATDMRKRGRELIPICKLGKNGVYFNLAKNVREAFEACELVRINCQGLNPSDYRKIGAKLKDLVPCVLLSFENEHILMWRGRDWKSSFVQPDGGKDYQISESDRAALLGSDTADLDDEHESSSYSSNISNEKTSGEISNISEVLTNNPEVGIKGFENTSFVKEHLPSEVNDVIPYQTKVLGSETLSNSHNLSDDDIKSAATYSGERKTKVVENVCDEESTSASVQFVPGTDADGIDDLKDMLGDTSDNSATYGELRDTPDNLQESCPSLVTSSCTEGVLSLLRKAVDSGSAVILDESSLDADMVYERSVAFAQVAPTGPVFVHRPRKVVIQKSESQESGDREVEKAVLEPVPEKKPDGKKPKERKSPRTQKAVDFKEEFLDVVPQGSLKIDELAKLLA